MSNPWSPTTTHPNETPNITDQIPSMDHSEWHDEKIDDMIIEQQPKEDEEQEAIPFCTPQPLQISPEQSGLIFKHTVYRINVTLTHH